MNLRLKKINKLIKQEVGNLIIRELDLNREVLITVTKTEVSADLRYADVSISVMPSGKKRSTLKPLKN